MSEENQDIHIEPVVEAPVEEPIVEKPVPEESMIEKEIDEVLFIPAPLPHIPRPSHHHRGGRGRGGRMGHGRGGRR